MCLCLNRTKSNLSIDLQNGSKISYRSSKINMTKYSNSSNDGLNSNKKQSNIDIINQISDRIPVMSYSRSRSNEAVVESNENKQLLKTNSPIQVLKASTTTIYRINDHEKLSFIPCTNEALTYGIKIPQICLQSNKFSKGTKPPSAIKDLSTKFKGRTLTMTENSMDSYKKHSFSSEILMKPNIKIMDGENTVSFVYNAIIEEVLVSNIYADTLRNIQTKLKMQYVSSSLEAENETNNIELNSPQIHQYIKFDVQVQTDQATDDKPIKRILKSIDENKFKGKPSIIDTPLQHLKSSIIDEFLAKSTFRVETKTAILSDKMEDNMTKLNHRSIQSILPKILNERQNKNIDLTKNILVKSKIVLDYNSVKKSIIQSTNKPTKVNQTINYTSCKSAIPLKLSDKPKSTHNPHDVLYFFHLPLSSGDIN